MLILHRAGNRDLGLARGKNRSTLVPVTALGEWLGKALYGTT